MTDQKPRQTEIKSDSARRNFSNYNIVVAMNWGFLLFLAAVLIFNLMGKITFGHGLGDLYYLLLLIAVGIVAGAAQLALRMQYLKADTTFCLGLIVVMSLIIVMIVLKITLLRGSEYPWNGSLFLT